MAQKILIKKSAVAAKVPTDAQLDIGELAVNTADALLYTKHSDGSIKRLSPTMAERTKIADSVSSSDARLTNSREWSEDTVPQAEAEGGIASTRRAWTAQRVRQAINAWWQLVTSGFGRNLVSASNEAAARNILQLGTAATKNVGEDDGDVMQVAAFGLGSIGSPLSEWSDLDDFTTTGFYIAETSWLASTISNCPVTSSFGVTVLPIGGYAYNSSFQILKDYTTDNIWTRYANNGSWSNWERLLTTGNILQTAGSSTEFPMSQKAVTEAIANIPSIPKSAAYTVAAADKGKSIDTTTDVTIPASIFTVGDIIVVTNTSATDSSITAAAGVTLRLAGTTSTGVRTLAGYGSATLRMVSSNVWFASGAGLS